MVIWKFPLAQLMNDVVMPYGAKVLHVAVQEGSIQLWAAVDPSQYTVTRHFYAVATGDKLPNQVDVENHVGTIMSDDRSIVFHVFEVDD